MLRNIVVVAAVLSTSAFINAPTLAEARKNADDGKALLLSDLLAQPFRVSMLRADGEGEAQFDNNGVIGTRHLFGFALTPSNSSATRKDTVVSSRLESSIMINPFASISEKGAIESPFVIDATFGKYDNYDFVKAQKLSRDEMKNAGYLRQSRYGLLRDTAMTLDVKEKTSEDDGATSRTVLSLATLDPNIPSSSTALGGRVGALTQAVRYEATGHVELEGVMAADADFYDALVAFKEAGGADFSGYAQKKKKQSGGTAVYYGTYTLTFFNRQEFTLTLKPLAAEDAKQTKSAPKTVTFYGFATPPITPESATFYSSLASQLGIFGFGGSAAEVLFGLPAGGLVAAGLGMPIAAAATAISSSSSIMSSLTGAIAVPMRLMLGLKAAGSVITNPFVEDKAKDAVESLAMILSWAMAWWPLLMAVGGVLVSKVVADMIDNGRKRRQAREAEEKKRYAKEAEDRLNALLGKTSPDAADSALATAKKSKKQSRTGDS